MATHPLRRCLPMLLGIVGLLACGTASAVAQGVTVELASGRSFTAAISERTDDTHLWLRFDGNSGSLLRPIEWENVRAAWIDSEEISPTELRAQAAALATPAVIHVRRPVTELEEIPAAGESSLPEQTQAELAREVIFEPVRVCSVDFDAYLANWDRDVDMDGLVLQLRPLDGLGCVLPVDGTVQVELIAPYRRAFDARPQGQGRAMQQIGRWTYSVRLEDFGPGGARIRLPFQAIDPEFDMNTGWMGLVHVRLVVPGAGTFEASHDPVRIRPFSPIRDDLQRVEHRRFFPNERTGRGQRATP